MSESQLARRRTWFYEHISNQFQKDLKLKNNEYKNIDSANCNVERKFVHYEKITKNNNS